MIEVRGLGVDGEDGARVLTGVSVTLPYRRVAVIGANGSGKSTFARVLAGLVKPSRGSASVMGIDVRSRRLRGAVGMVFSDPDAQILMPTPREDIALTAGALGLSRVERGRSAETALERYGLVDQADRSVSVLSGGQKQLLALAGIAVRRPQVLIADEPTTPLDLRNSRRVGALLLGDSDAADGAAGGAARVAEQLVLVTHDLGLARRCDHALRFDHGELVDSGPPEDVVAKYERDES
ncbi:energy-coupling factor ABC transporter ATP-binding protein [Microbacterium sp. GXS0129]|uniref:energy-coupling factor ABC transporter ATP-binding protein n=1 Tax=Microbacterium sp. GXS0129 TaxID=3377836 RepID=UPI00383B256D